MSYAIFLLDSLEGDSSARYACYLVSKNKQVLLPGVYSNGHGVVLQADEEFTPKQTGYHNDLDFLIREYFPPGKETQIKEILSKAVNPAIKKQNLEGDGC